MISAQSIALLAEASVIVLYKIRRLNQHFLINDLIMFIGLSAVSLAIYSLFTRVNPINILNAELYWYRFTESALTLIAVKSAVLTALNVMGLFINNINVYNVLSYMGLNVAFGRFIDLASQILYVALFYAQLMYMIYHMVYVVQGMASSCAPALALLIPLVMVRGIRPLVIPIIAVILSLMLVIVYVSQPNNASALNLINLINLVNESLNAIPNYNYIHVYLINSPYAMVTGYVCGIGFISYGESIIIGGDPNCTVVTLNSTYVDWVKVPSTSTVTTEHVQGWVITSVSIKPEVHMLVSNGYVTAIWRWVNEPSSWSYTTSNGTGVIHFTQGLDGASSMVLWAYAASVRVGLSNPNCTISILRLSNDTMVNGGLVAMFNEFEDYALKYFNTSIVGGIIQLGNGAWFKPIDPTPPKDLTQYVVNVTCRGSGVVNGYVNITGSRLSTWGDEGRLIAYTNYLYAYFREVDKSLRGSDVAGWLLAIPKSLTWLMYPLSLVGLMTALLTVIGESMPINVPILRLIDELRNLIFIVSNERFGLFKRLVRLKHSRDTTDLRGIINDERANGLMANHIIRRLTSIYSRPKYLMQLSSHGLLGVFIKSRGNPYMMRLLGEVIGARRSINTLTKVKLRHLLAKPLGPLEVTERILLGGKWSYWVESREFLVKRLLRNESIIFELYERGMLSNREAQRRLRYWFFRSLMEYRDRLRLLDVRRNAQLALTYLTHGHSRRLLPSLIEAVGGMDRLIGLGKNDAATLATLLSAMNLNTRALVTLIKASLVKVDKGRLMYSMSMYRKLTSPWAINYVNGLMESIRGLRGSLSRDSLNMVMGIMRELETKRNTLVAKAVRIRENVGMVHHWDEFILKRSPVAGIRSPTLVKYLLRDSTNIRNVLNDYIKRLMTRGYGGSNLTRAIVEYSIGRGPIDLMLMSANLGLHPMTLIKEILVTLDPHSAHEAINGVLRRGILDDELRRELTMSINLRPGSKPYTRLYARYLARMGKFAMGIEGPADRAWLGGLINQLDYAISLFVESYIRRNLGNVRPSAAVRVSRVKAINDIARLSISEHSVYSVILSTIRVRRSLRYSRAKYLNKAV